MIGKQVVLEEINQKLSHALDDYIKNEKLELLGDPIVDMNALNDFDFNNPGDLIVEYEVGLQPDFKTSYKTKSKVNKYTIEMNDDTFNKLVEDMQVKYGKVTDAEEVTEDGAVEFEFTEVDGEAAATRLILVNDINHEPTKKKVLKAKLEDEIAVADIFKVFEDKKFIQNHLLQIDDAQMENLKKKFTLTVKKIQGVEKAEMGQEFFDMLIGAGKVTTEEEFIATYKEQMVKNYENMAGDKFVKDVVDDIVENTTLELPDTFLKKWMTQNKNNPVSAEEVEKNYESYTKGIKQQIILDNILKDNDQKIDGEEIQAYMDKYMREAFGLGADENIDEIDYIAQQKQQMMQNQEFLNFAVENLRKEKLKDIFTDKVKFTEKGVDAEEFMKLN
jgi:trigger factor